MIPRKHVFSCQGMMQFTQDRDLLTRLAKSLEPSEFITADDRARQRHKLFILAIDLCYFYSLYRGLGESTAGGSLTFSAWSAQVESPPHHDALKRILLDYMQRGYLLQEFQLAAWDAICAIQFSYLIPTG